MSTIYFVFGVCQAITGCTAEIFRRQEAFSVDAADYPNVGTAPDELVVYFSRMGYGKKAAYEAANRTGADVYEIRAAERTQGTAGFWWCGRYGMHHWDMPILPVDVDLSAYRHVTICTPVWVFALAAPVRSFCRQAAGKIREADYIVLHFSPGSYRNVADEMDALLGIVRTRFVSVTCRAGRFGGALSQETDKQILR